MATKNEENWMSNYEELIAHVIETGHFFNKHNNFVIRLNYGKRIKAGTMPEEQKKLFLALIESRSTEHAGGRKKKASKV